MAEKNFDAALAFTLRYEGGFVNNPRDPGGATNLGITQRTLSAWRRRPVSVAEVRALTRDEAAAIYKALYWDHIHGDALPGGVDLMLFDIAVNMGVGRADQFESATGNLPPPQRLIALDRKRLGFWRMLRTFPIFGRGWTARETACLAAARKLL